MAISNKTKADMKKALGLIQKSQRIFLTTHEGTDGDDLGSALAMRLMLIRLGKHVSIAVHRGVPESLKFLPGSSEVQDKLAEADFDLLVTFGCNSLERTNLPALKNYPGPKIDIDHHPDNKLFGDINIVEPSTSSVAELMYYFFEVGKLKLDRDIATCLLTGIFTDTGGFKHANTTADTFSVASELMKNGAQVEKISRMILGQNNPAAIRVWARALNNTRFDPEKKVIFSVLTSEDLKETNATDEDIGGFVNFLISIPQARYSMLLRQDGDTVRGSLRSEPDRNVDVNKIAATFGGGGHKLASGFKLKGRLVKKGNGWQIV